MKRIVLGKQKQVNGSWQLFILTLGMTLALFFSGDSIAWAQSEYISSSRTNADTSSVKSALGSVLNTIPAAIRQDVFGSGCRIVIVPTVSEYMGMGYSDTPRGYTNGGGYDNADGLFVPARNQLLVSEKVSYLSGVPGKAYRIPYVVRHEFGHAYDYYLGQHYIHTFTVSGLSSFRDSYSKEAQRLTNSLRSKLAYFCQSGATGPSETFAEFFCMHCESTSEWSDDQRSLAVAFPLTDGLVKTVMSSPDAVLQWDR